MSDAERYFQERAAKLRRFMGLCPLTPEEAAEALKKMPKQEASEEEIDRIVDAVTRGELPEVEEGPQADWSPECDMEAMDRELALFRNQGDGSAETDAAEQELLEELLNDDELEEDNDGLEG